MFNLQPGTGLGFLSSKEIAFGLGTYPYVSEYIEGLEIFDRWKTRRIFTDLNFGTIECDLIAVEDYVI